MIQPLLNQNLPEIDLNPSAATQTFTLAMGCFWGAESLFGALEGVIRTKVGYAGGTTPAPTYRQLADHIESVQVTFDSEVIALGQLLEVFFAHHTPTKPPRKRQYTSALFFHSEQQKEQMEKALAQAETTFALPVLTELLPYQTFYDAEERHQKWKLRRAPEFMLALQKYYPNFGDFNQSTAVTRVNGFLSGSGRQEVLLEELPILGLSYPLQNKLLTLFLHQGGSPCAVS
ncbi:peptide-methionine (S)-S-oxide reductase MsrA [Rufibacter quisquiliarum]|uniref:Peptide methionine sulfoxide reductase MsrA n=1 Tax=Rufibacter quisquiliarum TaxID=1549639 RepID=A0A839GSL7_9BACT|nr:peptide-methionine (S)-S-oxide reductase MsrA [Rufibacter quisquiliarum]MBA9077796.1 methionine-S-sulfoxide reductase [Rufibacter quisquiliarum]